MRIYDYFANSPARFCDKFIPRQRFKASRLFCPVQPQKFLCPQAITKAMRAGIFDDVPAKRNNNEIQENRMCIGFPVCICIFFIPSMF